jgi:uncharacterized protein DUF4352
MDSVGVRNVSTRRLVGFGLVALVAAGYVGSLANPSTAAPAAQSIPQGAAVGQPAVAVVTPGPTVATQPTVGTINTLATSTGTVGFAVAAVKRMSSCGYTVAATGNELAVVMVGFMSVIGEYYYNPYNFVALDENHTQHEPAFAIDCGKTGDALASGMLLAGANVAGWVIFEVPAGDRTTLILRDPFAGEQVRIDLGSGDKT